MKAQCSKLTICQTPTVHYLTPGNRKEIEGSSYAKRGRGQGHPLQVCPWSHGVTRGRGICHRCRCRATRGRGRRWSSLDPARVDLAEVMEGKGSFSGVKRGALVGRTKHAAVAAAKDAQRNLGPRLHPPLCIEGCLRKDKRRGGFSFRWEYRTGTVSLGGGKDCNYS